MYTLEELEDIQRAIGEVVSNGFKTEKDEDLERLRKAFADVSNEVEKQKEKLVDLNSAEKIEARRVLVLKELGALALKISEEFPEAMVDFRSEPTYVGLAVRKPERSRSEPILRLSYDILRSQFISGNSGRVPGTSEGIHELSEGSTIADYAKEYTASLDEFYRIMAEEE